MSTLLSEVERFMNATGMPPSRFGRLAVGDSALVTDLRNGRQPRAETARRARIFMAEITAQRARQLVDGLRLSRGERA